MVLKARCVLAGAGEVPESANAHIPRTGCALTSEAALDSSSAVTSTDRVRALPVKPEIVGVARTTECPRPVSRVGQSGGCRKGCWLKRVHDLDRAPLHQ